MKTQTNMCARSKRLIKHGTGGLVVNIPPGWNFRHGDKVELRLVNGDNGIYIKITKEPER